MALPRANVPRKKSKFSPGTLAILVLSVVSIGLLGVSLVIVIKSEREPPPEAKDTAEDEKPVISEKKADLVERFAAPEGVQIRPEPTPPPKPLKPSPPPAVSTPSGRLQRPKTPEGEYRAVERKVVKGGVPQKSVTLPDKWVERRAGQAPAGTQKDSTGTTAKIQPLRAGYTVQVASYRQRESAERLMNRLKANRFDAYVVTATVDQVTYYRVRVGSFDSKDKARIVADRIRTQEKLDPVVTRFGPSEGG
jgi:cell division protein FtsN